MNKFKFIYCFFIVSFLVNLNYAQFIDDYDNINKEDIIDVLEFSGINIIKLKLEELNENHTFKIILDEYAGKNNFIKSDTLINYFTQYEVFVTDKEYVDKYLNSLKLYSRIINNKYDVLYLQLKAGIITTNKNIMIKEPYQKKHYWVKFKKTEFQTGLKIPLLFYGSEWDETFNGITHPMFCSYKEISPTLSDESLEKIPHFYIISYQYDKIERK